MGNVEMLFSMLMTRRKVQLLRRVEQNQEYLLTEHAGAPRVIQSDTQGCFRTSDCTNLKTTNAEGYQHILFSSPHYAPGRPLSGTDILGLSQIPLKAITLAS